jgi:hypothetical protein
VAAGDWISEQVEHILYREIDLLRRVHVHYHPIQRLTPAQIAEMPRSLDDLRV